MAMNYGEIIGDEIIKKGSTFFNLAVEAIKNTIKQYQYHVKQIWENDIASQNINKKFFATPMIGINDVNNNYFTLEDAKDLYNWAQTNNLAGLKIWSLNRDNVLTKDSNWSVTDHELKYLNLWDFAHVFTGD